MSTKPQQENGCEQNTILVQSLFVTALSTSSAFKNPAFCPHYTCVHCTILRTDNTYFQN